MPDSWKLSEIFATGIILGGYLAMMTVIFFWAAYKTNFFPVSEIANKHYAIRKTKSEMPTILSNATQA